MGGLNFMCYTFKNTFCLYMKYKKSHFINTYNIDKATALKGSPKS